MAYQPPEEFKSAMKFFPAIAGIMAISVAVGIAQSELRENREDIATNYEKIKTNEGIIQTLQNSIVVQQGQVALDLQRIENQQDQQSEKLNLILKELEEMKRR